MKKILILIADGDSIGRKMLKNALLPLDPKIIEVDCCKKCFDLIKKDKFDCALIYHIMPDCDGVELIKNIRKEDIDTPIIAITGQGDEELAVQIMKAGACDYIPKSIITPEIVCRSVQNAIKQYELDKLANKEIFFYKRFYDEVPVGLYRTSIEDGKFLKVNPFLLNLLGYKDFKELTSIKSSDLYDPERRKELIDQIKKNKIVQDFEIEVTLPKSGEKRWWSVTAKIYEKEGYLEGSVTDVTQRKIAETALCDLKKMISSIERIKQDTETRILSYMATS